MSWIIALGCFVAGAAIGALLFKLFLSDEVRVRELEERLQQLGEEHENYKSQVNGHFNASAQLLGKLTDSYRDVYLHMAEGARSLCPDYISSQLSLTGETRALLDKDRPASTDSGDNAPMPPLDYATRSSPDQKGALAEDYGFGQDPEKS